MARLFLGGVQSARVLKEKGLLLFETFTEIGAVDSKGIRWCTERIGVGRREHSAQAGAARAELGDPGRPPGGTNRAFGEGGSPTRP